MHSGLQSPIRVMSETSAYTASGVAVISFETSSWAMRWVMTLLPLVQSGLSVTDELTTAL